MVEAVAFWNEPNNKSHWDFEVDPGWEKFCRMIRLASAGVRKANPNLLQVLGGMSPIDPAFIELLAKNGVLRALDAVAVHGFPLDWNHWQIDEWPAKLRSIQAASDLPVWITEIGASTFGAEEVQVFGLRRSAELLQGLAPRIHWYSLFDLPKAWPATTRHREAEGSAYYRHFYMGLVREDGTEKLAYPDFARLTPNFGLCQWFHFRDFRLRDAVRRFTDLGVQYIRTGLSWADRLRPDALMWFDEQMAALEPFRVTATFCFTPEELGIVPHHTSAPRHPERFAEFCIEMVERYAPGNPALEKVSLSGAGFLGHST